MSITEAFALYDSLVLHKRKLKTRTNYRTSYRSLRAAVGDIPIELISEETIIVWRQHMTQEGCSGTTQRGYIGDLRSVMKYFVRKRGMNLYLIDRDELPKNDTAPRTVITAAQVSALISATKNPRDKAILACVFLSGCRISEILDLDRGDIDRPVDDQGRMEIDVCGKRDKYRPAYLNATALHYLYAYLDTRTDRYKPLFISGQNRRITVSRVEQIVHQCARDAGLQEVVTPHVLRHSFTTDLLNNGASLYEVSKLLGHSNIATTANIYGHFDTQARKQVLSTKQSHISIS